MTRLMQGFPPTPQGQVALANWRNPPFSRWAFQHVRELVPSADIANDPDNVRALASGPVDMGGLRIDAGSKGSLSLDAFLTETSTDGIVILQRGRVAFERYANVRATGRASSLQTQTGADVWRPRAYLFERALGLLLHILHALRAKGLARFAVQTLGIRLFGALDRFRAARLLGDLGLRGRLGRGWRICCGWRCRLSKRSACTKRADNCGDQ